MRKALRTNLVAHERSMTREQRRWKPVSREEKMEKYDRDCRLLFALSINFYFALFLKGFKEAYRVSSTAGRHKLKEG